MGTDGSSDEEGGGATGQGEVAEHTESDLILDVDLASQDSQEPSICKKLYEESGHCKKFLMVLHDNQVANADNVPLATEPTEVHKGKKERPRTRPPIILPKSEKVLRRWRHPQL